MVSGVCGRILGLHQTKLLCLLFLSIFLGIVNSKSNNVDLKNCLQDGREWYRATLRGGARAGNFSILRRTTSMRTCKELCCRSNSCEMALLVNGGCFAVQCRSADSCMPQKVPKGSNVEAPRIFVRDIKNFLKKRRQRSLLISYRGEKTLIREKRHAECHHYHGHVCNNYLDKSKPLYINRSPKILEEKLRSPFSLLKSRLLVTCEKYALKAICLTTYPYCANSSEPKPVQLCKEDCEELESSVCESDFRVARQFDYLNSILPNCSGLPLKNSKEGEGCVTLELPARHSKPNSESEAAVESTKEGDEGGITESSTNHDAVVEHHSKDDNHPMQPVPTEPVQSSQKLSSFKRSSKAPTEATKPITEETGLPVESVITEYHPSNNSFLQTSLGEINPSSPELNQMSSGVANEVIMDTGFDQVDGNISVKDIPLPSPSGSSSALSSAQPDAETPPYVPVSLNVSGEAEAEVDLAQSSDNTSLPEFPVNTSGAATNKTGNTVINVLTTGKSSPKLPTAEPRPSLQVSAGDNKVLTLPVNTVSLYASAWPKAKSDQPYSYHWQQISAPEGSHGYMEGQDSRRVILSQLDQTGVYQFKVKVTGANHAFGHAFINVTILPAPRVNKPPRADISPKEQSITLPTNEVVLDGSKSSDDDKIVQYKWEEVKGPLNDKNKMMSSGVDTPVLQLKSLVPGIYTFKLTVIDSDGESDSTTATVTVNDEKDYPPVARAGNDLVIVLPVNQVTLYANGSTDDKGIVSYEWSKAPSSPAVGDMQGTSSPVLKVSNMVVGDYAFVLKVTDTGGQTDSSTVTVVVQPEKNAPPVAVAGSDKDLVYPDDSTVLDASASHDDQKIVKYHWEQSSGPHLSEMIGVDEKVVTVKNLLEGNYVFKLTVTDEKGLTGTDTVAVNVKKDINKAPTANGGPDVLVYLPNRAAELDGSQSYDDHGIVEYEWSRDPKSPAAGDVINNSDRQAVLRLSNLVEGMYKFKLTVADGKGLKGSDVVLLNVREDENSIHLVELYLDVDITKFTEENKEQLIRKLAVILDVQDEDIIVEHLKEAGVGHSLIVLFYVKDKVSIARDGYEVAGILKEKIGNEEGFFEFRMLKVEAYICRNNCSGHGYCDRSTKTCVCESFWMQDIFKVHFGSKESNCDWSILYVTVIIFGIIMAIGGIVWAICFCMGRRRVRGKRRHHRYAVLDEDDDRLESMEMLPKGGKFLSTSLILSDTDVDSDDESTVFEAKKRGMNGSLNGYIRKDT